MKQKSPTPPQAVIEQMVENLRKLMNRPDNLKKPYLEAAMIRELREMGVKVKISGNDVSWSL